MILLPTNLAPVAAVADRPGRGSRFATSGVRVEKRGDTVVVQATDTKSAIEVRIPAAGIDGFPLDLGAGGDTGTVPAAFWAETFAAAQKMTRRAAPECQQIAARFNADTATFGATDSERTAQPGCRLVEGRYPPLSDVIASASKEPAVTVSVDPKQLANLLNTLAKLADADTPRVNIEIRDTRPIVVRVPAPADGLTSVVGLLVQLPG